MISIYDVDCDGKGEDGIALSGLVTLFGEV
jgi:hypothetical protein